ncbi:lytic polysaccharide monooxygenase auxiliary activity family 9 protein [Streptomyces sp. NBC_01465]|uniref:lytic polysaccharide monooxygenase auxiliary activity family 9 protein n=1 Tax=Streptomyces sp. NBC_01465 TaxID=2903878 RepID=UPI002E3553B6|nr:lytic polysaccharide monooxygenase [Streptomyces sp. NBC_01465]
MTVRRTAATLAAFGVAPLALTALAASPAAAHGSMTDPVSRVAGCYAEGPESPRSAACKAAVAASGVQAFYDWNAVNIANAAGNSKQLIPDGKLCSAGNDKYKGLDLARADWPASKLSSGSHTFRYKGTAPHKGSFELYITKDSYDPSKPLKWSDLEAAPFVKVTDPKMENGDYVFDGTIPQKSGRHLIYSIWQRSDSPEAFYTCSDVVFGQDSGASTGSAGGSTATAEPSASAPSDQEIAAGADKSTVHHNHTSATPTEEANQPEADGASSPSAAAAAPDSGAAGTENLAETGGSSATSYITIGGAAALAIGAAMLFANLRRKAVPSGGRHSR